MFVFHERWGSPTGKDGKVGTEEEWDLAEKLWDAKKIRNIVLFFKAVDPTKLADPGKQLEKVLAFRKSVEEGKRYLFHAYERLDEFRDRLDGHLARWLDDHERPGSGLSASPLADGGSPAPSIHDPGHAFWIAEARSARKQPSLALYFAERAIATARSDIEWSDARNLFGVAKAELGIADEAIAAFDEVVERLAHITGPNAQHEVARALFNKGGTLNELGRHVEAIAIYDDIVARFGTATEATLREGVARALVNKGQVLRKLDRAAGAINVCDEVVTRFGTATEATLREGVAKALVNKGVALEHLDRGAEAIDIYDDVVTRFGTATEAPLRERVARALVNKGFALESLDRAAEAIDVYDDVVARFGTATEAALRELVAMALVNKGISCRNLGRTAEALAACEDVVARIAEAPEHPIREEVARARRLAEEVRRMTAAKGGGA